MTIPGSANPLLLKAPAGGGGEYTIERSVRFNSSDSAYLGATFGTPTDQDVFTLSMWVKRSALDSTQQLFGVSTNHSFGFTSGDALNLTFGGSSALTTTALFRDPSAWYHVVWEQNGTAHVLYVNNVSVGTVTATSDTFNTGVAHQIGAANTTNYLNGYLADVHFIDGQALDPTSFGEFDDNGIWQPIAYSGSFGTNGFHLPFNDNSTAAALGTDTSGNGNDWSVNNISNVSGGPTSVASASGALPIYNTTDTYGTTKGTGTRTDSNSSSIVLAVAMDGANNGTTFTDESATIKGSGSAKTVTAYGNTKTITSESKFYGSSADFASDGTDYLAVSHSSDLNLNSATNFTIEAWVYADTNRTYNYFVSKGSGTTREWALATTATTVHFYWSTNGTGSGDSVISISHTVATARWNHIAAVKLGSTITLYVNGISIGSGSFTSGYSGTSPLYVGRFADYTGISHSLDGKINDLRIYNGIAKYTSNFNPPSSTQNATIAVGNDSLVDVPTNGTQTDTGVGGEVRGNYCTWNPLDNGGNTLSNGNLDITGAGTVIRITRSTFALPTSGKWYAECELKAAPINGTPNFGIISGSQTLTGAYTGTTLQIRPKGADSNRPYWVIDADDASKRVNTTPLVSGSIIQLIYDADLGKVWMGINNIYYGLSSGSTVTVSASDITNGTNPAYTLSSAITYFTCFVTYSSVAASINFGQRPFAYTAPSGFKALCTANLPAPTVENGSDYMDVVTYTGNGSTQTISGLGFSPDLVWIKSRSNTFNHALTDSVRGTGKELYSNLTNNETTFNIITALTSNGFSVSTQSGAYNATNWNSSAYVAWAWDAGDSTVTNTDGSITSSVRANPSAGFSIVSYTGSGSNATAGHGLGVAPAMIMFKKRSATQNWVVYHSAMGATKALYLDQTVAAVTSSSFFQDTQPTSSVFSLGTGNGVNTISQTFIAYCFAPVEGYSAFGSYTGNGSAADGPFVFTNHRPRWILLKRTDTTSNWTIIDTAREGYNVDNDPLYPDVNNAEGTTDLADILSNGFKLRSADASVNANAGTYIYASFAEQPFSLARAR